MSAILDTAVSPEIVTRARAGDAAALASIYLAFERPVRTLARRLVAHRAAAEDVAQDVFVDVITRLCQYEGRGSFAGWVRSIAVSRSLMHLRSPWQRSRRWLPGHGDERARDLDDAQPHQAAGATWDRSESIDLERALDQLPDTARAVVWLHDVEGYTHAEIAALFGATASFSKSQLARAHERLRELLQTSTAETPCIPVSNSY